MLKKTLGSMRHPKPTRPKPARVSLKLKLNSHPHMSYGLLYYLHKSLLKKQFFIVLTLKRNMQNPKHSSPAVSSRHNWPCSWKPWEPSSGSLSNRSLCQPLCPGAEDTQSLLPALEQPGLAQGTHRQSWHPPAQPGCPRQCPQGHPWLRLPRSALPPHPASRALTSPRLSAKHFAAIHFHPHWCCHRHTCLMKINSPFRGCLFPPTAKYCSCVFLKRVGTMEQTLF